MIDSPIGKLEMRACDHQVILPMYLGTIKKVAGYDFLLGADIISIPGKDYLPSCDEMSKLRK